MARDRTTEFSWAEVSPIAQDLRERLELFRIGPTAEFDEALRRARPALEELARWGGDPRFALCVLASARWRKLRSPGGQFPRWIRRLERLAGDEELHRLLTTDQAPRGALRAALNDALGFLRSFAWLDEGVLEGLGTRRTKEAVRWASRHLDRAAAVLNWHLRTGTQTKRSRVVLLARLLEDFGLIRSPTGETPPVEAIKQRLKRIRGDYYAKFVVPSVRHSFHELHRFLQVDRCGTACPPPAS